MPEEYCFLRGLPNSFNYLPPSDIKASLPIVSDRSRPSQGEDVLLGKAAAGRCHRAPQQGCPQGERAPAPGLPRKLNFWRGLLLKDIGSLGAVLLLPTGGWEVGEPEEVSHCCCWRNLPEGQSQPPFLGLPVSSAFNSLMTFLNNQPNPPSLPKRHLADSSEVKMSGRTCLLPAEFGCRSELWHS